MWFLKAACGNIKTSKEAGKRRAGAITSVAHTFCWFFFFLMFQKEMYRLRDQGTRLALNTTNSLSQKWPQEWVSTSMTEFSGNNEWTAIWKELFKAITAQWVVKTKPGLLTLFFFTVSRSSERCQNISLTHRICSMWWRAWHGQLSTAGH